MTERSEDTRWVGLCARCSVDSVFDRIKAGAQQDVEDRNAIRNGERVKFFVADKGPTVFSVYGEGDAGTGTPVTFRIDGTAIVAQSESGAVNVKYAPALNEDGDCILRDNEGSSLSEWQFRMKALKPLFFDGEPQVGPTYRAQNRRI